MSNDDSAATQPSSGETGWKAGAWAQFGIGSGVLLIANALVSLRDPGWAGLNPSPWLILPLYFGLRFGYRSGLGAAALVVGVVLLGRFLVSRETPLEYLLREVPYFLWSFPISAVAAAFARSLSARRGEEVASEREAAARRERDLRTRLEIHRENEEDLKRIIAVQGIEMAGFTDALHHLFSNTAPERLSEKFLAILEEHCGVLSSAVYEGSGAGWEKTTVHHDAPGLPDVIVTRDFPMCGAAVESGEIVTQERLWESGVPVPGREETILVVVPYRNSRGVVDRLLLVHRMSFDAVSWENMHRLETAFTWFEDRARDFEGVETVEIDTGEVLGRKRFIRCLEQAVRVKDRLGLPARVVLFSPADGAGEENLRRFVEALMTAKGRYDILGVLPLRGHYVFCLIVPAGSDEAAEAYADRLLHRLPDIELGYGVLPVDADLFGALDIEREERAA